jgi:hypothetical protein
MAREWHELHRLTQGAPIAVERVRLVGSDIAIEGSFEIPPLAQLSAEDQVFVMAFVRSHGSIKEMEQVFGISYPTVKNRLNRISEHFQFVETMPVSSQADTLSQLERGDITVDEAIERMSK